MAHQPNTTPPYYGTIIEKNGEMHSRIDVIAGEFDGGRLISISEMDNGNFAMQVDNLPETGRDNQLMLLTKDSFFAFVATMQLYLQHKKMTEEVISAMDKGKFVISKD